MTIDANEPRKLVDEVACWLRLYDDASVDRTWTGPPELQFLATPYHPSPSESAARGVTVVDVSLPPPYDLPLRIYTPTTTTAAAKSLPVLLHFQGGGFCISRPTWFMYYNFYSRLSAALPAIVISVSTRLAPEHRLPAAMDDCHRALVWLLSGPVGTLPISADLSRVFLIGDSSGGNLVHEVAIRAGRKGLAVAGAIPIHPGFLRSWRSRSELEGKQDPFLTLEMMDKFLALALPEGATKDHPYTCPMGTSLEGVTMPPVMVAVAEADLLRDRNMEYCEWLKAEGKEVEVFVNGGVGHSFYLNAVAVELDPTVGKATGDLIQAIKTFVDSH